MPRSERLTSLAASDKPVGIGIDIVSLERASQFLSRHRDRISSRLLAPSERKNIQSDRITPLQFARIFAAKEAYYKATGGGWPLGIDGFSQIEVSLLSPGKFAARRPLVQGESARGIFFRQGSLIGAECLLVSGPKSKARMRCTRRCQGNSRRGFQAEQ